MTNLAAIRNCSETTRLVPQSPIESSLLRKIKNVVFKIFDSLKSLHFCSYKVSDSSLKNKIIELKKDIPTKLILQELEKPGSLNSSSFNNLIHTLSESFDKIDICTTFTSNLLDFNLDYLPELKDKPIAIPVTLNHPRNNMVLFFIDPKEKTIEFYDPKGLSILDRAEDKIAKKMTLNDAFEAIETKYQPILQKNDEDGYFKPLLDLKENTHKHQHDLFNSGAYVLDYCSRRASGESFEEISTKGKSFSEIESFKKDLFTSYVQKADTVSLDTLGSDDESSIESGVEEEAFIDSDYPYIPPNPPTNDQSNNAVPQPSEEFRDPDFDENPYHF